MNNQNREIENDNKSYSNQLLELIKLSNKLFGTEFFDKLEELNKEYFLESNPNNYKYELKINNIGAFYAG